VRAAFYDFSLQIIKVDCKTEIADVCVFFIVEKNVLGLDVSMNNSLMMDMVNSCHDLDKPSEDFVFVDVRLVFGTFFDKVSQCSS